MRRLQQGEIAGGERVAAVADRMRSEGFTEVADEMQVFARQEVQHSKMLCDLLKRYKPHDFAGKTVHNSGTVYRCIVCGYEYIGDISIEADDYVCPLCGQRKALFELK